MNAAEVEKRLKQIGMQLQRHNLALSKRIELEAEVDKLIGFEEPRYQPESDSAWEQSHRGDSHE